MESPYGGSSNPVNTEEPFQSLEEAESGNSYTVLKDECYLPAHKSRGWIRCFIYTSGTSYRLYLETRKRFLLSAVQVDNDNFLISSHEDFPCAKRGESGYSASVTRHKDRSFLVTLNTCHYCDNKLGRMTCGHGPYNREVVAKVKHKVRRFKLTNADMRCIMASFPYLGSVPKRISERNIWCPRSLRQAVPQLPPDADTLGGVEVHPNKVNCINKLPEWNPQIESLVLKFQGNRVLSSSSKNFLLYEERKLKQASELNFAAKGGLASESVDDNASVSSVTTDGDLRSVYSGASFGTATQPSDLATTSITPDAAILQFGKNSDTHFIMDFKYPLSPLQAFGICLCSFAPDTIKQTPRAARDAGNSRPIFSSSRDMYGRMRDGSDDDTVSSISSVGSTGVLQEGSSSRYRQQPGSPAANVERRSSQGQSLNPHHRQPQQHQRPRRKPSYSAQFAAAKEKLDGDSDDEDDTETDDGTV